MELNELESYAERQEDELQILQSIFGDDVEDLRNKDAWKVARPPEFTLHLRPQEGMSGKKEAYCHLSLRVKFPPTYPDCSPELKMENSKGLSSDGVASLEKEMKDFCKTSLGEVMMLQVAQKIQEYLHEYNVPQYESAYEEMVRNKQKQLEREAKEEEKKKEVRRRKEEIQRREIEEELARREEEERRLRKLKREEREMTATADPARQNCDEGSPPKLPSISQIHLTGKNPRTIYQGQCLGRGAGGSMVYAGMDSSSGELVAVHYWNITSPARKMILTDAERAKLDKYLKTISTVEQELQSLVKLSHNNIVAYLSMKTTHCEDCIEINILQEYVKGISLQHKLDNKEKVPLDVLRSYTEQMLFALDYLHSKSVVHKQFKASSVFLDANGKIKVADYSIGKRLVDLYNESRIEQPGVRFSDDRIPARSSKKGDLMRLGIVILSLAQGSNVLDYPPEVSSSFPRCFYNFLEKCLVVEDRLRLSASELLDHDFIKPSVELLGHQPDIGANEENVNEDQIDLFDDTTPEDIPSHAPQLSRLHSEFEELEWLGKGGYGDVVKVRNKLDDRHYAIKRILLNPHHSQFNKKITREVKLLSRLNHEHVVRYYNSWIETIKCLKDDVSVTSSNPTSPESKASETFASKNSLGLSDDIEKMAPPPVLSSTSEWSMSVEEVSRHGDIDEEDDDDGDVFKTIYFDNDESSSSESILFDHDGNDDQDSSDEEGDDKITTMTSESTTPSSDSSNLYVMQRYLYIQMEYCEKSTLRQTIDAGLSKEQDRMWRLFREILEGLVHVHQQGMIHRDLKPQNIFLDRNDHVKIGDFGLATARTRDYETPVESLDEVSSKSEGADSGMTGVVGTALYVAPELQSVKKRSLYSQKVDIYSVGIIFFEMFYPGLETKMERVKVLGKLRTPSITFPHDFKEELMEREALITRWCLDHEPSKRPTASELLKCRHVPTPVLEEHDVLNAMQEMLSDPLSKQYRLVINQVFDQEVNPMTSIMYDIDLHKHQFSPPSMVAQQRAFKTVAAILRCHGAVKVNPPQLLPRESNQESDSVSLMDIGGTIVTLPYNLRVPFARFVSCSGITKLKGYAIEKVFRSRRRSRPKELWECSFEIVTPTCGGFVPDAEVLSVVNDIVKRFPVFESRKYQVRINHMMSLKAILTFCGLEEKHHSDALDALSTCDRLSKSQIETCLSSLPLNHQQVASLSNFTQTQGPLPKIQIALKTLTRNKHLPCSSWARQALHELEAVKKCLESFQMNLPVIFDLGFTHKYHHYYNGVIFQVFAEIQKRKRSAIEVLAMGGRYDKLMENLSHLRIGSKTPETKKNSVKENSNSTKAASPCAVGVSIAIEKVIPQVSPKSTDLASNQNEFPSYSLVRNAPVEVLVCAVGRSQLLHERLHLVKSLWDAGIAAETAYERNVSHSQHDVQERAHDQGISHLVLVSDKDRESIVVKSLMHDPNAKPVERKLSRDQVVDYLTKKRKDVEEINSNCNNVKSSNQSNAQQSCSFEVPSSQQSPHTNVGTRQLSIKVISPEKLAFNTKKRYEYEIRTKLSTHPLMANVSNKAEICVIAVDLPSTVMKPFGIALDVSDNEDEFNSSLAHHLPTVPRYKKYMAVIADTIHEAKFVRGAPFIILYSYKDNGYCMMI
ncbi:unnamed protein product [Clavelina lepadiformis]|uniref:non-specific serine/threonine protein kinase n=1 Tax=Clavelina lepadiformis TaxID=159417 RepID=A0ABP0FH22_CLALP